MNLSILDAIQKPKGQGSAAALRSSIDLAQSAEGLGYSRYWIVEHHGVAFEANPAPEVFAAALAAVTSRIRIGVGGVLLNHYSPYKVAEAVRTLHALFPGRIDVGIGRATSGPLPDAALKRLRNADIPDDHPQQVEELIGWLGNDLPESSPFRSIKIMPDEAPGPLPWILAVSEDSAIRAASLGLALACSAFHLPANAPKAMAAYHRHFRPTRFAAGVSTPTSLLAIRVTIGETQQEAERLAMPVRAVFKLRRQDKVMIDHLPCPDEAIEIMGGCIPAETSTWPDYVVGTPARVKAVIERMAKETGACEVMVQEFLDDPELRLRNCELLAQLRASPLSLGRIVSPHF
jgi:luciferase family oxidoreductase group 1